MDTYVRHLLDQAPLDAERERELATRSAAGDRHARNELICASQRLVALRAVAFGFGDNDLADAVQAGTVGLIRAIDRYDPGRGARLGTYAWWWIGHAMRAAVPPPRERPMGDATDVVGSW